MPIEVCNGNECHKGREIPCKKTFRVAFALLTPEQGSVNDKIEKLEALKLKSAEELTWAGRGLIKFDLSYPVQVIRVTEQNKALLLSEFQQDPYLIKDHLRIDGIVNAFLATNPDNFEFLFIIADWPYAQGVGGGWSANIQNNIMGIGLNVGRQIQLKSNVLEQFIYASNYENIFFESTATGQLLEIPFDRVAICFNQGMAKHEIGHRWAAYLAGYQEGNAIIPFQRSGVGAGHWRTGLSTNYDPSGGGKWKDNQDGTFTLLQGDEILECVLGMPAARERFSLLTLYLMGAIKPEKVPSMLFVKDYDGPLEPGVTVPSASALVPIDAIIKANGAVKCLADFE
jgi:hypothetical protein